MDANRTPRWVWACGLFVTIGCTLDYNYPAAQQPRRESPEPKEPPQVVDTPPPVGNTAADTPDVDQTVLGWIERLDRVERRPASAQPWLQSADPIRHALDVEPAPASQPVATPPTAAETQPSTDASSHPPAADHSPSASQPTSRGPPQLASLEVRIVPDSAPPVAADPPATGVNAAAYAAGAPRSLHDLLEQLPPATEGSFREQLDRRLLWVIAGDNEQARTPLELVTAEQQELAGRFVETWIALREWHAGDQAAAATAAARELRELLTALQRLSDLSVPELEICRAVRGFGQYDPIDPARFAAGVENEFVLYCEVRDFVSQPERDGHYTTRFDLVTAILNRAGETVLELRDTDLVDRCANRRQDCFIPRLVRLPATLSPGRYVAKVTVIDKLGQKVAENRAPFEIAAGP